VQGALKSKFGKSAQSIIDEMVAEKKRGMRQ
jgi:hypothetical protein